MSQSPNTTSHTKSTDTPNPSPLIVNATPITTIHPSFTSALKKTTAKRSSTSITPKSKKTTKTSSISASKKTTKAKTSKSKPIHNMQELYLDDIDEENVKSHVETFAKSVSDLNVAGSKSDFDAETLEVEKGVTGEAPSLFENVADEVVPDSPVNEESLNNKIVEDVLNSLKDSVPDSNVVPDVETSLAQEKPASGAGGDADGENLVSQVHEETEATVGKNTGTSDADNVMSAEDNVVDVDALADLKQTMKEVASGSIARRLRNRKGNEGDVVVDAVTKGTKSGKKPMVGPNRKPSKVEVPSQKKKSSVKRKQASVGDSDYEGEEDVPHMVSNIVSSAKKKSPKKLRRAATAPVHDVVDDVPNIVSTGKKKIGGRVIPQNVPDVPMDNISFHFIESAQK
jgi:hypothetical protein